MQVSLLSPLQLSFMVEKTNSFSCFLCHGIVFHQCIQLNKDRQCKTESIKIKMMVMITDDY